MIKKILPYIIGLSLLAAPALAASIKYSQLTSGGTIATTDVFPVLRTTAVSNAVTAGGLIKLTVDSTTGIATNDQLSVSGITGTTEANGQWIVTVNDATHLTLQGSVFAHAYVSGGQVNFNPGVVVGALAATTPGTGVATALGINIGSAGAPVTFNGALGTPSSGTATNLTGTASALNIGGNAATASAAPASGLTGTTLASGVTASSLTSVSTLTGGATGAGFTVALGSSTITGTLPAANNETNLRHTSIGASFSGGGSAIAANSKQWVYVPYGTTIQSSTIACDQTGSIVFDVQMDTYANFSTAMTSIVASAPPTVTSAQKAQDLTLTGWTTAIPAGDYILFKVTSATTVTNCNIVLDTVRT